MRRLTLLLLTLVTTQAGAANMPGTDRIPYFGYEDCILLENAHTRVVLTSSAWPRSRILAQRPQRHLPRPRARRRNL